MPLSTFIPARRRIRRKPRTSGAAPPAALTLIAASYESFTATLSFDRAIDVSAFDPSTIYVNDADRGMQLQGGGEYGLTDPNTVNLSMSQIGDYGGYLTTLSADAQSGIIAVDDGGTWAGCDELGLPYP